MAFTKSKCHFFDNWFNKSHDIPSRLMWNYKLKYMKNSFFILIGILLISTSSFSQSCNCYVNIDSTFRVVPMPLGGDTGGAPNFRCNNCSSAPVKLPFSFCFYGKKYDTVFINNKGSLSFVHPVFNFSSTGLPEGKDTLMLAVFDANINERVDPVSDIYYKITPTHLIVQWSNTGFYTSDADLYNDMQITITNGSDSILPAGNNVSYCYWLMRWATADSSGGLGGFGGTPSFVGVNKGDYINYAQFGTFMLPGSGYSGPFGTSNGVYWLNNRSFTFNTCVTGNNIPPVIVNPDLCDTLYTCSKDTGKFTVSFLCPEKGQKATITASSPGLSGITIDTSSANSVYTVSGKVVTALKDTGAQTITITATDNSSPPLANSIQYIVIVNKYCDTTGINEIKDNNNFVVYPNPNNGRFIIQAGNENVFLCDEIRVYDIPGRMIYSSKLSCNKTRIDLSAQPKGMYFVELFKKNVMTDAEKIIIQ